MDTKSVVQIVEVKVGIEHVRIRTGLPGRPDYEQQGPSCDAIISSSPLARVREQYKGPPFKLPRFASRSGLG